MKIDFIRPLEVDSILRSLIIKYEEIHWAVAWGSYTDTARLLIRHNDKFRNVSFGIAFSQTDPKLIKKMVGLDNVRVVKKYPGGTFHPKVYAFRSGNDAAAVIGSANFTIGGLGRNSEAAVLVEGDTKSSFFKEIFSFVKDSAQLGVPITSEFASIYEAAFRRASKFKQPAHDPLDDFGKMDATSLALPLVSMTWSQFSREVRASRHHNVDDSLALLRIAQKWFASVPSFSNLSTGRRQALAGTIVNKEERKLPDEGREWGWFGSMRGMGDFARLINANDPNIARAIDAIPQKGEVSREHFITFVENFQGAFDDADRVGGYATASRLLAMKRPDVFVCICKPNIVEASRQMGFSRTTLKLEDCWDKVVEVIRHADWYNIEKQSGEFGGALWESRAAMLDAILYRPYNTEL